MRFPDIYSLGEYNNVRTNLHSYGFGDIFLLNGYYCLPTYDSKIMVYKYCWSSICLSLFIFMTQG